MADQTTISELEGCTEDQHSMPPPYWRHSGVTFQLDFALYELQLLLKKLMRVHEKTERLLDDYYDRRGDNEDTDPESIEFGNITDGLCRIEHSVKMKCELIGFLSAIKAEEELNKFMTYNLPQEVVEASEKLAPPEKLLIAASLVGVKNSKSIHHFGELKELMNFRNAFAHGHCTDRPTRSIAHNHLVDPGQYPCVPDTFIRMKKNTWSALNLTEYLEKISKNSFFAEIRGDDERCRARLREVGHYHIEPCDGINEIYTIFCSKARIMTNFR